MVTRDQIRRVRDQGIEITLPDRYMQNGTGTASLGEQWANKSQSGLPSTGESFVWNYPPSESFLWGDIPLSDSQGSVPSSTRVASKEGVPLYKGVPPQTEQVCEGGICLNGGSSTASSSSHEEYISTRGRTRKGRGSSGDRIGTRDFLGGLRERVRSLLGRPLEFLIRPFRLFWGFLGAFVRKD